VSGVRPCVHLRRSRCGLRGETFWVSHWPYPMTTREDKPGYGPDDEDVLAVDAEVEALPLVNVC